MPSFAKETQDEALIFAINDSSAIELSQLSDNEMLETEGEYYGRAGLHILGGGLGAYGSTYGYIAGGGDSFRGLRQAAVTGFVSGAFNPVRGFASGLTAYGAGFTTGSLSTFGSRSGWW